MAHAPAHSDSAAGSAAAAGAPPGVAVDPVAGGLVRSSGITPVLQYVPVPAHASEAASRERRLTRLAAIAERACRLQKYRGHGEPRPSAGLEGDRHARTKRRVQSQGRPPRDRRTAPRWRASLTWLAATRASPYFGQRFAAVILRIRDPKTTALVFGSGKMVVTGAKSEDACRLAAQKHARIVQKVGFDVKFQDFKIQNMVGSCDVKFPIRLEGLAVSHSNFSSVRTNRPPGPVAHARALITVPPTVLLPAG